MKIPIAPRLWWSSAFWTEATRTPTPPACRLTSAAFFTEGRSSYTGFKDAGSFAVKSGMATRSARDLSDVNTDRT